MMAFLSLSDVQHLRPGPSCELQLQSTGRRY